MKQKRSLGQNFFINKNLGEYIVNKVVESRSDFLIEIGPGTGFFTQMLITHFQNILLIEKDDALAKELSLKFPSTKVIPGDFLQFNLNSLKEDKWMYFGSLPYNVSKPIIYKIISSERFYNKSFFIIQKEVAEKYIYRKPYSMLSLITALYADCEKILDISPESFKPRPNVISSLISFTPIRSSFQELARIESLITLSFRHPRKNLYNNLRNTPFEKGSHLFKTMRPSQLSLEEYKKILNYSS